MAPPRTNTPSRRRPNQSTKVGPQLEAETEVESSAPRAKTPHRRHHNQVTQTEPEAEIETTETVSSRALTAWHNRRPSRSSEADADAEAEAEKQLQKPAQPTIPTENPPGPHKWALYFANLVRSPFIPSTSFNVTLPSTYPFSTFIPTTKHTHTSYLGVQSLQQERVRLPIALLPSVNPRI